MKAENDDSSGNPNFIVNGSRKRTILSGDEETKSKIQKVAGEVLCWDNAQDVNLLSLSDDVLLIIMAHLDATDLMNLRLSCRRLADVASDWSLWRSVDFRPSILSESQLWEYVPLLRETTEYLAIRGSVSFFPSPQCKMPCLSKHLLLEIKENCPSLKSFIAEEHFIDAHDIKVSHFPSSLKHWSLKGSTVVNLPGTCSYFVEIYHYLPNLQVLELTDCAWVPSHSIMALSKLPHLQELHVDGCRRLKDCIAYASLAFSLGFSRLEVLDLRRTGFSDSELSCINRFNRLTHVYLEYSERVAGGHQSPNVSIDEDWDNDIGLLNPLAVSDTGLRSLVNAEKPYIRVNYVNMPSNEIVVTAPIKDMASRCRIHTIVARHFPHVTDATLDEMRTVHTLCYLDLTGTGITMEGATSFRASRPQVTLVTSFDNVT